MKKVLFVSGSIGLGHVGRALEDAGALRRIRPDVEISWMAEPPASGGLEKAGEPLLPEAGLLSSATRSWKDQPENTRQTWCNGP